VIAILKYLIAEFLEGVSDLWTKPSTQKSRLQRQAREGDASSNGGGGLSVLNGVDVSNLDEATKSAGVIELNSMSRSSTSSRLKKLESIYSNNSENNENAAGTPGGDCLHSKTPRATAPAEAKSAKSSLRVVSTSLSEQHQQGSNLSLFKLKISNEALSAANAVVTVRKGVQKIELQQQHRPVRELSTDYEILERLLVNDLGNSETAAEISSSLNELKVKKLMTLVSAGICVYSVGTGK
jgi:hypothetical protein